MKNKLDLDIKGGENLMSGTQATHLIGRFVVLLLLKPVGDVVFPACLKARLHIMCF